LRKNIKFYVLYDDEDFPVGYFKTLNDFSNTLGFNYDYVKHLFMHNCSFANFLISGKKFTLYKFYD
jgi:hypothetical protein